MALIGYGIEEDNQKFTCAGTLLSDQWVISGVYCANDKVLGDARHIQLGGIQRLEIEPSARLFTITQIVKHPLYTPLNMEHDIILLKMNEPAILNLYILPICLPQTETLPERAGIATGWRKTGLRDELSSVLLKINVNYYPITTCQDYDTSERSAHVDYKGMICAGANNTCQNDPGSPIQYCNEDVYCTYTITGVIARTTCNKEGATIYTNVFEYLDWIENVVWPNGI